MYNQINRQLPEKIKFSNLNLSIFPLTIKIKNIKNIPFADENLVSFKQISIEIPFWSLFSKAKEVDLIIHQPKIIINEGPLTAPTKSGKLGTGFSIRAVKIDNGFLRYNSNKITVFLDKFNLDSVGFPNYTAYQLNASLLKIRFPMYNEKVTVEGNLTTHFKQYTNNIKINKFSWSTRKFRIHAHGKIFRDNSMNLNTFFQGNPETILTPMLEELTISGLVYGNARITVDKKSKISVSGKFRSNSFSCSGENFSDLHGRINWDNISEHTRVSAYFLDGQYRTSLKIDGDRHTTQLIGGNMQGKSVSKVIDIYRDVPIGGMVEKADLLIKGKAISGTVQIRPKPENSPDFNFQGKIGFRYHSGKKTTHFHSDRLVSEFGTLSLTGDIITPLNQIDLTIRSRITEMGQINKYSKYFIFLDLEDWTLQRGQGLFGLEYHTSGKKIRFSSTLSVQDFICRNQPVGSLRGIISGDEETVRGSFTVGDPAVTGRASLFVKDQDLKIHFEDLRGKIEKILPLLNIDLPIYGPVRGEFRYTHPGGDPLPQVSGDFTSDQLTAYDIHFNHINGHLESNLEYVELGKLKYTCYGGTGNADIFIDYQNRKFKLAGKTKNIQVDRINSNLNGTGWISFSGEGDFNTSPLKIDYGIDDFYRFPDRVCRITGKATAKTDFSDYELITIGFAHHKEKQSPFNINLTRKGEKLSGIFKLHLKDINYVIPWKNNRGVMTLNGQIGTEESGKTILQGLVLFRGEALIIPGFPHTLKDFKGMMTFKNSEFTLSSLQGKMANGEIQGNGVLILEKNQIKDLLFNFSGKNMNPYLIDRTSGTVNADLRLKKADRKLLLQGNLYFTSLLWEREVDEGIEFFSQPESGASRSSWLDQLEFDINLTALEDCQMNNTFGNIFCRADLKLTGDINFPILSGKIVANSGEVYFSDRTFNLIKAKILFNNKFQIDPHIDLQSEAFIKNYRIRFNIRGPASRIKPEFRSSPPLPPQDVLALISLGELFKRPTSTEMSSQMSTTSMISTELTENLEKRVKKIFGIDLLKFDPMISGTSLEGESRVSVGKAIAKNFIIVYSTNISTSRQEILYLVYQISPSISLIGMRNEDGHYSIDIRFRKRR